MGFIGNVGRVGRGSWTVVRFLTPLDDMWKIGTTTAKSSKVLLTKGVTAESTTEIARLTGGTTGRIVGGRLASAGAGIAATPTGPVGMFIAAQGAQLLAEEPCERAGARIAGDAVAKTWAGIGHALDGVRNIITWPIRRCFEG